MKNLIFVLASIFTFQTISATTFYVIPNKTGDGTSWANASGDLNAVLFAAKYGDEVWVAGGTYFPTKDNNRKVAFVINNGVKVYGGFTGTETSISQRNWKNNTTILSGAIGNESTADNSLTVVYTKNTDENTLLDGFTITDGCSNIGGLSGEIQKSGGAMYNDGQGETGKANIIVRNCSFNNNYGRDGGAIYNNGKGGNASPTFENCAFTNNRSDLDGGAIFNDGRTFGISNPTFKNCQFKNNKGNYGGVMCNYGGEGQSNPIIENCQFENNESYMEGHCFFNFSVDGEAQETVIACQFVNQKLASKNGMNDQELTKKAVLTSYKSK